VSILTLLQQLQKLSSQFPSQDKKNTQAVIEETSHNLPITVVQ